MLRERTFGGSKSDLITAYMSSGTFRDASPEFWDRLAAKHTTPEDLLGPIVFEPNEGGN